ncbi:MAG: MBL fold metallo-hydrolase [Opitutaceae bacterium]|nr:MBL fold metallo-hydrolase [Opitutaceae bacterium]
MITITVLSENTARGPGILGEHGLAWWIDTGDHRVLFDTGQGLALRHNAARLGIDLARADAIVLSHGHYDHVGGLETAMAAAPGAALYLHPRAKEPKYSGVAPGVVRRISTDFMEREAFRQPGRRVVITREPAEVVPGVWMTGEVPRANDFEDTGGPFFLDKALTQPDPLLDDQSLHVSTPSGLLVIFGCAHAGVVNTLGHIARLAEGAPLRLIIGGLHLENASARRMEETVRALRSCRPAQMGFCHCTGLHAIRRLWREFPEECVQAHAGLRLEFAG